MFVDVFGAVVCATFQMPDFHAVVVEVGSESWIERVGELQLDGVGSGVQSGREPGGSAGRAKSIKAAVGLAIAGPGVHAAGVKIAIIKSSAHNSGGEIGDRQLNDAALNLGADIFVRNKKDAASAVGQIEKGAVQRAPTRAGDADEFAR